MNYRYALLLLIVVIAVGCSSDPDTPLGTEFKDGGLIDSDPGDVTYSRIRIDAGDMSFLVNRALTNAKTMSVGRKDGRETAMMIRFNFSNVGSDTLLTVTGAELVLRRTPNPGDSLNARIYEFNTLFSETDTLTSLDLDPNPVPDDLGNVERVMTEFPTRYQLPKMLVQDWIRGNEVHNGIAITLNDARSDIEIEYGTSEDTSTPSSLKPYLEVQFGTPPNNVTRTYNVSHDGTFVTDISGSPWMRLSDGETRRIFVPVDLSAISTNKLLHDARIGFRIVEGSIGPEFVTNQDRAVQIYAPKDSSPKGLLDGDFVVGSFVPVLGDSTTELILPIRSIIEDFISDPSRNHGLVLRLTNERVKVRTVDFFSSADADTLRPFLEITVSDPPTFPTD